jgi:hypothetical protein
MAVKMCETCGTLVLLLGTAGRGDWGSLRVRVPLGRQLGIEPSCFQEPGEIRQYNGPVAFIFAWTRGLLNRANYDGNEELIQF